MNKVYKFELPKVPLFSVEDSEFDEEIDVDDDYDHNEDYWDNYDYCYECTGYGDDYYFDEETGEWESACEDCPHNPANNDWND